MFGLGADLSKLYWMFGGLTPAASRDAKNVVGNIDLGVCPRPGPAMALALVALVPVSFQRYSKKIEML